MHTHTHAEIVHNPMHCIVSYVCLSYIIDSQFIFSTVVKTSSHGNQKGSELFGGST